MMYGTLRREFEELKSQIHLASCVCVVSVLHVSMRYLSVSTVRPSGFHFQLSTHTDTRNMIQCRGTECSRAPRLQTQTVDSLEGTV